MEKLKVRIKGSITHPMYGKVVIIPVMSPEEADSVMMDSVEGWCLSCGEVQHGVEPDARGYRCESCGNPTVYGFEELVIRNLIKIKEPA